MIGAEKQEVMVEADRDHVTKQQVHHQVMVKEKAYSLGGRICWTREADPAAEAKKAEGAS